MAAKSRRRQNLQASSISSISVSGFKSIASEQSIDTRPLTLLAGANSSGKSSMMQAVLLLKQTLEASYDPGPLLLNGPNVRFTSADQMLFHGAGTSETMQFLVRIGVRPNESAELVFARLPGKRLELKSNSFHRSDTPPMVLTPGMGEQAILDLRPYRKIKIEKLGLPKNTTFHAHITRDRCFLRPVFEIRYESGIADMGTFGPDEYFSKVLQDVIHVPGLRGNPERSYPLTATGPEFPGTFEKYTASVVAQWSRDAHQNIELLSKDLNTLGLTWKVEAKEVDDTRVELKVGRLKSPRRGGAQDLVNIADVGFGVSQTLPVVVALLAAQPGQLLYIEQPEIHLHPRAQFAMASVLSRSAKRGVQVVVETHSSLLLLGVQSQVALEALPPEFVKLHWFSRNDTDGATTIKSAELDEAGRFGDWPEDFDEVSLTAQSQYLDAAESLLNRK